MSVAAVVDVGNDVDKWMLMLFPTLLLTAKHVPWQREGNNPRRMEREKRRYKETTFHLPVSISPEFFMRINQRKSNRRIYSCLHAPALFFLCCSVMSLLLSQQKIIQMEHQKNFLLIWMTNVFGHSLTTFLPQRRNLVLFGLLACFFSKMASI